MTYAIAVMATLIVGCATPRGPDDKSPERAPAAVAPEKSFGERYEEWTDHARVCIENAIVGTFGLAVGRTDLFTERLCRKNIPEQKPAASP